MQIDATTLAYIYIIVMLVSFNIAIYKSINILFNKQEVFAIRFENLIRFFATWIFLILLIFAIVHIISLYSSYDIEGMVPQVIDLLIKG